MFIGESSRVTMPDRSVTLGFKADNSACTQFGAARDEGLAHRAKWAFDRVAALLLLFLLAPLFLLIAFTIRLTTKGPAFFRHERVGRGGRPFRMWKFRTMYQGSEAQLADLLQQAGRGDKPLFKLPCDPRVTPIGQLLRCWSLDEIPQLINVLSGEMSLVGPRPQVAAEVALYSPREAQRLIVRPGITGLWQVSGRSSLPWRLAVERDLYYVREWSLGLDARILLRTLGAVIDGRGAI